MEELKNIHNYKSFLETKNNQYSKKESIDEGLLGAIGKGLSSLWNKGKEWINKVKGCKEVETIYKKKLAELQAEIKKQTGVELHLSAEEQMKQKDNAGNQQQKQPTNQQNNQQQPTNQNNQQTNNQPKGDATANLAHDASKVTTSSFKYSGEGKMLEEILVDDKAKDQEIKASKADGNEDVEGTGPGSDANKKMNAKKLREKEGLIKQLIDKMKQIAVKDMTAVLTKMGGPAKNPKLAKYVDNKKDEFDLAFLNAQITACEEAGDKTMIGKLTTDRDKLQKALDLRYDLSKADTYKIKVGDQELAVGKFYRYKKDDGTIAPIKIIGPADKPNKVKAAYVSGDSKDKEQEFTAKNIDSNFKETLKTEFGKADKDHPLKYMYWSDSAGKEIEVTIKEVDENTENATVFTDNGEFNIEIGRLLKKVAPVEAKTT